MKIRSILVCAFLVACGASESDAKESLEKDGYTDVKITNHTGDEFKFTAKDKKGASCTGSIKVKKGMGSTQTETTASCSGGSGTSA